MSSAAPSSSAPMKGGGFYNSNSHGQRSVNDAFIPFVDELVAIMPLADKPNLVQLADFGCSQAKNSLLLVRTFILSVRRLLGDAAECQVYHTDLPSNDWTATLAAINSDSDPNAYLSLGGVYSCLIGRSFYHRCLPSESLVFAYSACAQHWLSGIPKPINDVLPYFLADASTKAVWKAHGKVDWKTLLMNRSAELKRGGIFACVESLVEVEGKPNSSPAFPWLQKAMHHVRDAGIITQPEIDAIQFPMIYRTMDEFLDPETLEAAGLEPLNQFIECRPYPKPPIVDALLASGDRDTMAKLFAASLEAAFDGFLKAGVTGDAATKQSKVTSIFNQFREEALKDLDEIINRLYQHERYAILAFRKK